MADSNIREMTIQDFEVVQSLWHETEDLELTIADSKESIARFLERSPGFSFVALEGDLVVGAVLCGHDGRKGYIDHLAVRTSHRRQGIGRSLVARCLYKLIHSGIRKWHLFVMEDNNAAIAFWKKLGWAQRVELVTMSQGYSEAA